MRKNIYIIVIILALFNVFLFLSPTNTYISNLYTEVTETFNLGVDNITNFFTSFSSQKVMKAKIEQLESDNKELEKENEKLETELKKNDEETQELKESLNLDSEGQSEEIVAEVLYKKLDTPLNVFVINKGKNDGIKKNQIVTYEDRMIGYIDSVDKDTSEVLLLKNDNLIFNIPIVIKTEDMEIEGVIYSYSAVDNSLIVNTFYDDEIVEEGAKVYTNGYIENQEKDIYVGEITDVDSSSLQKDYKIQLKYSNVDYVEVHANED